MRAIFNHSQSQSEFNSLLCTPPYSVMKYGDVLFQASSTADGGAARASCASSPSSMGMGACALLDGDGGIDTSPAASCGSNTLSAERSIRGPSHSCDNSFRRQPMYTIVPKQHGTKYSNAGCPMFITYTAVLAMANPIAYATINGPKYPPEHSMEPHLGGR